MALVSGKGEVRNVSGGDVNLFGLSMTGVDGIFFDGQGGTGSYAALSQDTSRNSILFYISGRVGRTLDDITVGNGGDASFRLPAYTQVVNDGRFANTPFVTDFVTSQYALGYGTVSGGSLTSLVPTAGITRITVSSNERGQYLSVPGVMLDGGGGQAASALAQMGILVPTILSAGTGLTPGDYTISALGGGGSGASIQVTVGSAGTITSVQFDTTTAGVQQIGTGYTSQPTFDLTQLGGSGASLGWANGDPFLQVSTVQIQNPGIEYSTSPLVSFATQAGEVAAQASAVVGVKGGLFYHSAPVVNVTGGGVQQAAARALLNSSGGVGLIAPQIFGQGYTPSVSDGSGGLTGPTVTLSGGGSATTPNPTTSATVGNSGRAFVSEDGLISVFHVTDFGSGYDPAAPPQVVLSGGLGSGISGARTATARAIVSGVIPTGTSNVQLVDGGLSYSSRPQVVFQGGGGGGVQAVAIMENESTGTGKVVGIRVTSPGTGYASAPTVTFIGGDPAMNAIGKVQLDYGVTSVVVVDPGYGYTAKPTVSICGTGSKSTATAQVAAAFDPNLFGKQLNPIWVSSSGAGYTSEPTVTIQGGGVREAQARAIVQKDPTSDLFGRVVGFWVTDAGEGYKSTPNITIGYGQAFGNFGEYGISTETVDRNVGSGNISISNVGAVRVGSLTLNAPVRTGDAQGVQGGDAITGSILIDIGGDVDANTLSLAGGGGARGVIITGDATVMPSAYSAGSIGNARSGSITLSARQVVNSSTSASTLVTLTGSTGLPVQIGVAQGGLNNTPGSLNGTLVLRDATNTGVGDFQVYAPAPGEIQAALGNIPLDPNHLLGAPRVSNDLAISGLVTPATSTDDNGNVRVDESLVTVEVGSYMGKLTLLRRAETQATATVSNGRVTLITPDQGGQLYASTPTVIITGGGIEQAQASAFVSKGTVVAPNGPNPDGSSVLTVGNGLDNPGSGYFTVPQVTFEGGGGSGVVAVAVLETTSSGAPTGRLKEIQILNPGYGFTSLPTLVIGAPAGVLAQAQATVTNQTITQTTLTVANGGLINPGVGYTIQPYVTITGGLKGTARATATIDTDPTSATYSQITAINITLNGDTFPSAASITIGTPSGAAKATANLQSGSVSSFTITNPGGGYLSQPQVILTTSPDNPYSLLGDRLGLIADRLQLFETGTPANLLIETTLAAVAPWTNQRPVSLVGSDTATSYGTGYATIYDIAGLQRFQVDNLVVGRRNPSHLGVGAGTMTVATALNAENLRVSEGLFLAGTRGLSDLGAGSTTGIAFRSAALNFGSNIDLQGSVNAVNYLAGIIQGPCDELSYGASFNLSSRLRSINNVNLPVTIGEVYGDAAYFTGRRFNQGITTQNGNVTILADLLEQTRLVGFIDTTGGGAYPVSYAPNNGLSTLSGSATVTLAPLTSGRAISIYANNPGSGLALRIGNPSAPGLEQIKAASVHIGSSTSGNITLLSDFAFNYGNDQDAPRALALQTAGSVTLGLSQIPPSPNPVPTTSSIKVPVFSVSAQSANLGAYSGSVAGPSHSVDFLAAQITGAGNPFSFTSSASSLSIADLSALGGIQGIQTSAGNVTLTALQINLLEMQTSGLATIRAAGARVTLQPLGSAAIQLGVTEPKAGFSFTNQELNRIAASYLQIGSGTLANSITTSITIAGPVTFSQSTAPAITQGLTLVSAGAIQDVGGTSGISYSPGNLILSANGVISLTGSGNNLGTVVANSNGNNITLTSGTPFVISSAALDSSFPSIAGIKGQGATVTLQPGAGTPIFLGDLTGGKWGFTSAQLNAVTAANLVIGNASSGAILVNGVISLNQGTPSTSLQLVSGSTIGDSGGSTGILYPGGLSLSSIGAISFTGTGNDFGTVTATSSGNNITLTSSPFDIATINAGTAVVTLAPVGAVPVVLGSPGAVWGFDNTELNAITAGVLRIGSSQTTLLTINSALGILSSKIGALHLISNGAVQDSGNATGLTFYGGGLAVEAAGNVTFSGTANQVGQLAVKTSGDVSFLENQANNANPLLVGSVDGIEGINTSSGNGNVTLTSDDLAIQSVINAGAGTILLQPKTVSQSIGLFGGTGNFDLTTLEMNRLVTSSTVTIGRADGSGNVNLGGSGATFGVNLIIQSPQSTGTFDVSGDLVSLNGSSLSLNAGDGTFRVLNSAQVNLGKGSLSILAGNIDLSAGADPALVANGGVLLGSRKRDTYVGLPFQSGALNINGLNKISSTGYISFGALGGGKSVYLGSGLNAQLLSFGGLGLFADSNAKVQLETDLTLTGGIYIDGPLVLTANTSLTGSSVYLLNGLRSSGKTLTVNSTGNFTLASTASTANLIGGLDLTGVDGSISLGMVPSSVPSGLGWVYDSFGTSLPTRGLDQRITSSFTLPKSATLQGGDIALAVTGAGGSLAVQALSGSQNVLLSADNLTVNGNINASGVRLDADTLTLGSLVKVTASTGDVQVTKNTSTQSMVFGGPAPGRYLSQAQILQLSAPNGQVILGSTDNTGGILLAGPLNFSGTSANLKYALQSGGNIRFGDPATPAVVSLKTGGQLTIDAEGGQVIGSGGTDIAGTGATVSIIGSASSVNLLTDVGFYGPVSALGPVTLVNAGSVTIAGAFNTGSSAILVRTLSGNLTLAAQMTGGLIQVGAAQNFINRTGLSTPFHNSPGQRTLVYSAGQRYDTPYNFAGLSGFGAAFGRGFGSLPGGGNFLVYSQYAQTAFDEGVAYYEMFSGNSVSALLALSPDLFWSVNGVGTLKTRPGGYIDYMLYPQRVEPETKSLPQPVLSRLERKLGRPPTLEEIASEEADQRRSRMLRSGRLVERSSFDPEVEPRVEARRQVPADRADAQRSVPVIPQAQIQSQALIPTAQTFGPGESIPHAATENFRSQEVKGPSLRKNVNRAVALRSGAPDAAEILAEEREKAELNLAAPVAGNR